MLSCELGILWRKVRSLWSILGRKWLNKLRPIVGRRIEHDRLWILGRCGILERQKGPQWFLVSYFCDMHVSLV